MNIFNWQGCIKLIRSDRKDVCNVSKDFYFRLRHSFHKNIKQQNSDHWFSTLIIIRN